MCDADLRRPRVFIQTWYYPVAPEPEDGPFADVDDLAHAQQGQKLLQRPRVLGAAHDSFEEFHPVLERGVPAERGPLSSRPIPSRPPRPLLRAP